MNDSLVRDRGVISLDRTRFPHHVARVRMPNVTRSIDDVDYLHHRDLGGLDDQELYVRRRRSESVLAASFGRRIYIYNDSPFVTPLLLVSDWAAADIQACDEEIRHRRARSKR